MGNPPKNIRSFWRRTPDFFVRGCLDALTDQLVAGGFIALGHDIGVEALGNQGDISIGRGFIEPGEFGGVGRGWIGGVGRSVNNQGAADSHREGHQER